MESGKKKLSAAKVRNMEVKNMKEKLQESPMVQKAMKEWRKNGEDEDAVLREAILNKSPAEFQTFINETINKLDK